MGEAEATVQMPAGTATRAIRHVLQVGDAARQSYARRLGVGRSDYLALAHIYYEGPTQPRDLGARLAMGSGTLTPLLDRLEQHGYAARTPHPLDRRRLLIVLTPQGQAAMDAAFAEFDGIVTEALEAVGLSGGLGRFTSLLDQLSDAIAERIVSREQEKGSTSGGGHGREDGNHLGQNHPSGTENPSER
ncbi:MarR family winged helix-turn-helix transcriptional regulator [Sinomonas atrocyanea]|uniref:MarR family winged helix-turn-helix transcriptional regulator n=1 Tax=Sinomonas atrocyanea TaxID=37927 RepID=UPI003D98515B